MVASYPGALPALPKPTASTHEDDTGFEHDLAHVRIAEELDAFAATLGLDSGLVATAVRSLLSNLTTGHRHDNVDSRRVPYASLASIPATFAPAAHGRAAHTTAITVQDEGGAAVDVLGLNFVGGGVSEVPSSGIATVTVGGGAGGGCDAAPQLPSYIIRKNGSNFEALDTTTSAVAFSNTDGGALLNSALGAIPAAGGSVGIVSGTVVTCAVKVTVPAYCQLLGPESLPENFTHGTIVQASATIAGGLVELAGTGSTILGISVNGNAQADHAVRLLGAGQLVTNCTIGAGKSNSVWFDGASGCARSQLHECRIQPASNSGGASLRVDGSDHILGDFRVTGAATSGRAAVFSGTHTQVGNARIVGAATAAANTLIDTADQAFSNVAWDGGPNGTNGRILVLVKAGQNQFTGCKFYTSNLSTSSPVTIQMAASGSFVQGNTFIGCGWDGGGTVWVRMLEFLDENGSTPTTARRFAGTTVMGAEARATTEVTNLNLQTIPFGSLVRFVGVGIHQNNDSTPALLLSDNYGTATFDGDGSQKDFNIAHGLGQVPSSFSMSPAAAAIAGGSWYVSNITNANLVLTFKTAPVAGTGNIVFAWRAWI